MPTNPGRAIPWLRCVLLLAGLLSLPLSPTVARAQTAPASGLAIGVPAQTGNAGGDTVLLRDGPGHDATPVNAFPEGTPVALVDGPFTAADGTVWFGVDVGGQRGYIVSDYLVPAGSDPGLAAPAGDDPAGAAAQPAAAPAATDTVTTTDVNLRAGPSYDDAVLTVIPAGTALAPTGETSNGFLGVTYNGQPGWVDSTYVGSGSVDAPAPVDDAQELVAAQPAAPAEPAATGTVTTTDVNLRDGPSYDNAILRVIPSGATVTPTGEASDGFLGVTYDGLAGWVDAAYLGPTAPTTTAAPQEATQAAAQQAAPTSGSPLIGDPTAAPAGQSATATDVVNLRDGPSETDPVLRVLPPGSPVTITGDEADGFVPVWYNGTSGWIASGYLDAGGAPTDATAPSAFSAQPAAPTAAGAARQTTDAVNLRSEPSIDAPVVGVVPPGSTVETTAGPDQGFYQVSYGGVNGWVSGAYLTAAQPTASGGDPAPTADGAATDPAPSAPEAAPAGSGLIWPVKGGTWEIMQGYNGSSHQNEGSLWQYQYSLDLVRTDGETALQPVYSPATGTVRWLDPSTGGISIDIGNGHAVALFHVTITGAVAAGTPVLQGQPLGYISGPGGPGFMGTPHVHFTLWATTDGGNWSRTAEPFVGPYAIGGEEFPDIGGSNEYQGYEFTP